MNQPSLNRFFVELVTPWRPFEMVTLTPDLPSYFPDSPPGIDCMRVTQSVIWRAMKTRGVVIRERGRVYFIVEPKLKR